MTIGTIYKINEYDRSQPPNRRYRIVLFVGQPDSGLFKRYMVAAGCQEFAEKFANELIERLKNPNLPTVFRGAEAVDRIFRHLYAEPEEMEERHEPTSL